MSNSKSTRFKIGFILFSISLMAFSAVMGGNIYQIIAEVPNWSADIPNSLIAYREFFHVTHPGFFFQTLVPLTVLSLITSIILLRNRPKSANKWMLIALAGVVLTEVFTLTYFLPKNFVLFLDPLEDIPVEQLGITGELWQTANYLRMAIVLATMIVFLKTYQIISSSGGEKVS
ncbi:MAG: DUF1772 domain-containing protein [Chitinophagaceae bacterium]|nr:MAG: DUF1772 domain-containing protein [Chitinophagaceae bacterium]